jgi:hypothetical protein
MSTQGSVGATLHIHNLPINTSFSLPNNCLVVEIQEGKKTALTLQKLVQFALNAKVTIPPFLNVEFVDITLTIDLSKGEFIAKAQLNDISPIPVFGGTLREPALLLEVKLNQKKVCVSGRVEGGVLDKQKIHYCYPKWKPKPDKPDKLPPDPKIPPIPPSIDPTCRLEIIALYISVMVGVGYTLSGLLSRLLSLGMTVDTVVGAAIQAIPEIGAGESVAQIRPTEITKELMVLQASNPQILQGLLDILGQLEAYEADLEAKITTQEAAKPQSQNPELVLKTIFFLFHLKQMIKCKLLPSSGQ